MVTDDDDPTASSAISERTLLFDDTYAGPRWRYGLPRRHLVSYLATPVSGWILYSERRIDDPRFPFGTIDYPRELTDAEARQHVLEPLGIVRSEMVAASPPATRHLSWRAGGSREGAPATPAFS